MALPLSPSGILNAGGSYLSQAQSLLKNPANLLAGTPLSFLSSTTLSRMEGRSDPQLNCFFNVQLPVISKAALVTPEPAQDNSLVGMATGMFNDAVGSAIDEATAQVNKLAKKIGVSPTGVTTSEPQQLTLENEYVEEINLVFKELSSKEVWRAGGHRKYVDNSASLGDLQIKFYGGINSEALPYLLNWQRLVMNSSGSDWGYGGFGLPSEYKYPITVHTTDENDTTLYTFDYIGCWIKTINEVQLDSNGERVIYDATFSVDDVLIYATDNLGGISKKLDGLFDSVTGLAGNALDKGLGMAMDYVAGGGLMSNLPAVSGLDLKNLKK